MRDAFLPLLLLRDGEAFRTRLRERRVGADGVAQLALFVCLACAVYGAALAGWRSPRLSLYVAAKLPMVFVGSTLVVAVCNAVAATLLGTGLGTIILVVAQGRGGRGLQPPELGGVVPLQQRPDADVYDVSAEQDEVRLLYIYKVYPPGQLGPAIVITQVQVTGQHYLERTLQVLVSTDGHLLAVFVMIVDSP